MKSEIVTAPVLRFAPSPNGYLHLGHAYSALLNAQWAERLGGRLLLRIEDIDTTRCRPAFEAALLEDLRWLGLTCEEPIRRQSEHFDTYTAAFSRLRDRRLAYPCFCSRKDLSEATSRAGSGATVLSDPDGVPLYGRTCRNLPPEVVARRLAEGAPHTWRLDMAAALADVSGELAYRRMDDQGGIDRVKADPARWGDAVIVRREVPTSYHLSVVVDDALQGVTHVVRGQDLEAATDLHVLLQALLGLPTPIYHHHRLIADEEGEKLAKSRMSESLRDLRARGVAATDIRHRLGFP